MSVLAILATLFGTISGAANIPQTYKIFRRECKGYINPDLFNHFDRSSYMDIVWD